MQFRRRRDAPDEIERDAAKELGIVRSRSNHRSRNVGIDANVRRVGRIHHRREKDRRERNAKGVHGDRATESGGRQLKQAYPNAQSHANPLARN